MKTPRELLLRQHQAAEPKLDAIRQATVAATGDHHITAIKTPAVADRRCNGIDFWRELFSFRPQMWAGLAAVWIAIFALKISTCDTSSVVAKQSSMSPEVVAEVRQQKLFFAELAGLHKAHDAEPPKLLLLRPRSELRDETFAV